MKRRTMISAVAAMSMIFAGTAMAQGGPDQPRPRENHRPPARPQHRGGHPPPVGHGERGAGPDHNFYRGGRLSAEYRNRQYVVDDWRAHHLSAPPRGYHWVQVGADYVLVAIATGIIAQVLLSQ